MKDTDNMNRFSLLLSLAALLFGFATLLPTISDSNLVRGTYIMVMLLLLWIISKDLRFTL